MNFLILSSAGVAMLLASIAETVYSYSQVTFHLVQRLTREQLFYISTFIMYVQNKPSVKHIENHFISVKSLENMRINLGDARLKIEALLHIFLIMFLMMCSLFLLHRISTLEPKMLASTAYPPEKILLCDRHLRSWKLTLKSIWAETVLSLMTMFVYKFEK
ncbi:hypothetical protein P5673_023993 [Acropora cervicornis]|uniref:Uncharacterized protein n=1 Tax=Acropora cervicornis TaxID=6130 RepID=A0AAD9UYE1_ACRCE|nr:hypothetical protein P5673_023993 [Acropora cervicornis]